jgi:hypothetical protein
MAAGSPRGGPEAGPPGGARILSVGRGRLVIAFTVVSAMRITDNAAMSSARRERVSWRSCGGPVSCLSSASCLPCCLGALVPAAGHERGRGAGAAPAASGADRLGQVAGQAGCPGDEVAHGRVAENGNRGALDVHVQVIGPLINGARARASQPGRDC